MLIWIPYGRRYTATYRVRVWIPERCDHCGALFAFAAHREAQGSRLDLLWLNPSGAGEVAEERAKEAILAEIKGVTRRIPCPGCGRFSTEFEDVLKTRWRAHGIAIATVLALLWLFTSLSHPLSTWSFTLIAMMLAAIIWGIWRAQTTDMDAFAKARPPRKREYHRLSDLEFNDLTSAGFAIAEDTPVSQCPSCGFQSMNEYATQCPHCHIPLADYEPTK